MFSFSPFATTAFTSLYAARLESLASNSYSVSSSAGAINSVVGLLGSAFETASLVGNINSTLSISGNALEASTLTGAISPFIWIGKLSIISLTPIQDISSLTPIYTGLSLTPIQDISSLTPINYIGLFH